MSQAMCAGSAEMSSFPEPQYFPYRQPGYMGKIVPNEKKKRWDTGTERDARQHTHEDKFNPYVVSPNALWGLRVRTAEIL